MKPLYVVPLLLSLTLALGACATAPSADEMAQTPVVRYGEITHAKSFVLLYPAGTPLPVVASVSGTLLSKGAEATMNVKLKRDVYVYQHWASFDGKHWERGDKLIQGMFKFELPGYRDGKGPLPGRMIAEFNLK